jgi:long-subunit fatty acid transport protein
MSGCWMIGTEDASGWSFGWSLGVFWRLGEPGPTACRSYQGNGSARARAVALMSHFSIKWREGQSLPIVLARIL